MADVTLILAICMSATPGCTGNAPSTPANYQCTFSGAEGGNHVGRGHLKFSKDADSDSTVTIRLTPNRFQFHADEPVKFYANHQKKTPYEGGVFESQNATAHSTSFMDKVSTEDDNPHVYQYSVTVTDTQTSTTVECDPTITHN